MMFLTAQTVLWVGLAAIVVQVIGIALQFRAIRRRSVNARVTIL